MPESKSREKKKARPQDPEFLAKMAKAAEAEKVGNPAWLVPVMLGLMVTGLIWIVVYYLTGFPIRPIHAWNLAIGFGMIIAGFVLTTRWK